MFVLIFFSLKFPLLDHAASLEILFSVAACTVGSNNNLRGPSLFTLSQHSSWDKNENLQHTVSVTNPTGNGKSVETMCCKFSVSAQLEILFKTRWVSVVEFHDQALSIGKVFGQESTVVKWNYQILSLHLVTVRQKVPILDFQSEFSMSKIIRIFLKKFSLKNINLSAPFL